MLDIGFKRGDRGGGREGAKMRRVSEWAKMPIDWVRQKGLVKFTNRADELDFFRFGVINKKLQNNSIAALKLYVALCCRTDYETGLARVTYDELVRLTNMSRPVVAKALARLEQEGLIERELQALSLGSAITMSGWAGVSSFGKIPKEWLYDHSRGATITRLQDFKFTRTSLNALKIYLALLSYRDNKRNGLAVLTYDYLALTTGVPRNLIAEAITMLYHIDLISFRPGDFGEDNEAGRTNRYLVRGLGLRWPSAGATASA